MAGTVDAPYDAPLDVELTQIQGFSGALVEDTLVDDAFVRDAFGDDALVDDAFGDDALAAAALLAGAPLDDTATELTRASFSWHPAIELPDLPPVPILPVLPQLPGQ